MMLSHIVYTSYILQVHLMKSKGGGTALIVNSQHQHTNTVLYQ